MATTSARKIPAGRAMINRSKCLDVGTFEILFSINYLPMRTLEHTNPNQINNNPYLMHHQETSKVHGVIYFVHEPKNIIAINS